MRKLILVALLTASTAAFAFSSGPYYLAGGVIPAKACATPGHLTISLAALGKEGDFNITCDIHNELFNNGHPVIIKADGSVTINGRAGSNVQFSLDKAVNKYTTVSKSPNRTLSFTNFDDEIAVKIDNCVATYVL